MTDQLQEAMCVKSGISALCDVDSVWAVVDLMALSQNARLWTCAHLGPSTYANSSGLEGTSYLSYLDVFFFWLVVSAHSTLAPTVG